MKYKVAKCVVRDLIERAKADTECSDPEKGRISKGWAFSYLDGEIEVGVGDVRNLFGEFHLWKGHKRTKNFEYELSLIFDKNSVRKLGAYSFCEEGVQLYEFAIFNERNGQIINGSSGDPLEFATEKELVTNLVQFIK